MQDQQVDPVDAEFAGALVETVQRSFRLDESIAALPICALWG